MYEISSNLNVLKGKDKKYNTICEQNQFQYNLDKTNGYNNNKIYLDECLKAGVFNVGDLDENVNSKLYKGMTSYEVITTFRYMFDKFKKGIYVRIKDGELCKFLPFSKANFTNEWGHLMKHDESKFKSMNEFLIYCSSLSGYKVQDKNINSNREKWYANNFLIRNEYPIRESNTGLESLKDMFVQLCKSRKIPDIEFFINRRDFPVLKKDLTEPYDCIFGRSDQPLLSHKYESYAPILGMSRENNFSDILIPTFEDWKRVVSQEDGDVLEECKNFDYKMNIDFSSKKSVAVFRGSNTGYGTNIQTNNRLKLSHMSYLKPLDDDGSELLDAGITKWNTRPQKEIDNAYLSCVDIHSLKFDLVDYITPEKQSDYKYIINIDGHVSAYRLALELSMGSVVLMVESKYKLWFHKFLKEGVHYVGVKRDLSDLLDKIKWCKRNEDKCKEIASNALVFYKKYLCKNAILDYLQLTLNVLKKNVGTYYYPSFGLNNFIFETEKKLIYVFNGRDETDGRKEYKMPYLPLYLKFNVELQPYIKNHFSDKFCRMDISKFIDLDFEKSLINDKNNSKTFQIDVNGINSLLKITDNDEKKRKLYHSFFVGRYCINGLTNFSYTYGIMEEKSNLYHLSEYIEGISLQDLLKNGVLSLRDLITIIIQICFILRNAQEKVKFIHYNLYPWNVIIKKNKFKKDYNYFIDNIDYKISSIFEVYIANFEYSIAEYGGMKYGCFNFYHDNYFQDILSILFSSLGMIISKNLKVSEINELFKIMKFVEGSDLRSNNFRNMSDIKLFLYDYKKINYNGATFSGKNPFYFVNHILSNGIKHNLGIEWRETAVNYKKSINIDFVKSFLDTERNDIKSKVDIIKKFILEGKIRMEESYCFTLIELFLEGESVSYQDMFEIKSLLENNKMKNNVVYNGVEKMNFIESVEKTVSFDFDKDFSSILNMSKRYKEMKDKDSISSTFICLYDNYIKCAYSYVEEAGVENVCPLFLEELNKINKDV